jgi:hypothetical protein
MRELVDGLVQSAQNNGMQLYGVHVYRRGEEPVERRLRSDDRVNLRSVSKTFVSVALGIAEAEGSLALDDPALRYYPELKGTAAPGLEQVTLRHLLTMTSGSPHSWLADEPVVVPDLAADFFATPLAHEPGSYFSYTGTGPYVAACARPSWPASADCCWTMAATRAASWSPPGTARGSPPKASPRSTAPRIRGSAWRPATASAPGAAPATARSAWRAATASCASSPRPVTRWSRSPPT